MQSDRNLSGQSILGHVWSSLFLLNDRFFCPNWETAGSCSATAIVSLSIFVSFSFVMKTARDAKRSIDSFFFVVAWNA